jgi:hypothetical protein
MPYKLLATPFAMAAQLGVAQVAASLPRAGRRLIEQMTRRHVTGGGITTAEGVYYSPAELLRLGELEGLGITAVEAERLGSLADDILAEARRADRTLPTWSGMSPFQKGFWTRTAEAMERSYRQGLFEARLLAGDTPAEAARTTRRAALDYTEIPDVVRDKLGTLFQGAGTAYKLATGVILAGAESPQRVTAALKAMRENKRRQDPADLGGDSSLLSLVVGDEDHSAYLRVPGSYGLLTMVEMLRHGTNVATDLAQAATVAAETGDALAEVWTDGQDVTAYSLAAPALSGVLRALDEFEGISAALPESQRREAQQDALFWSSALLAHDADPTHEDLWPMWEEFFEPRVLEPPPERAVEGRPGYWRTVPPGQPHVYIGQDAATGLPLYRVLEPSDRGRRNLEMLRAMTPEQIERAIPAATALLRGTESSFSSDAPVVRQVFQPSEVNDLGDAIIGQLLNPTGIDFSDPEGVRKAQAERVLEIRAVPQ